WIKGCDVLGIEIKAKAAIPVVAEYCRQQGWAPPGNSAPPNDRKYSPEAFVNSVTEWIIADDQSLNVIELPQLRAVFMMLREELRDSDIPHRTTICKRVQQMWYDHLDRLQDEMEHMVHAFLFITDRIGITVRLGWITMDNASNNDTFVKFLEEELHRRHICIDF
ncbi:hypothetical protein BDN71DRAFT_1374932, partial [Pleurotus eryngii]